MVVLFRLLGFLTSFLLGQSMAYGNVETQNFQKMNPYEQLECLQEKASTIVDSMGPGNDFMKQTLQWMKDNQKMAPLIMGIDNQRVQLIEQMGVTTANAGGPLYELRVGPDGEKTHVFRLMQQMTKHWNDREKMTPLVQQVCNQFDSRVADFCVDGFWKKLDNINAFLKRHEQKITELSENPPSGTETWMDKVGSYIFERDAITDSNLRFGASVHIGDSMMESSMIPTPYGNFLIPVEVRNGAGQVVGSVMPITTDGSTEYYFAETVSANPLSGSQYLNPFYFIFGTDRARDWNDRFSSFHQGLFVGDQTLDQWIQLQKQAS